MLWQTGYLTLRERMQEGGLPYYRLSLPNLEVRATFNRALLSGWLAHAAVHTRMGLEQRRALVQGDVERFRRGLEQRCASIPHDWCRTNPITQ